MTNTVYNQSVPGKQIAEGLVEVFDVADGAYFTIALDGKIMMVLDKHDNLGTSLLKRKFVKSLCEKSGLDEEKLTFVYIDWQDYCEPLSDDYYSGDYRDEAESYQVFLDTVNQHGVVSKRHVRVLAKGLSALEECNL